MRKLCTLLSATFVRSRFSILTMSLLAILSTSAIAQPYAYVANYSGSSVSVVNLTNNVVGPTIAVPGNPFHITVSSDSKRVIVTTQTSNSISIIDSSTNTVIGAPIPVGGVPGDIAISPNGSLAYVTLAGLTTIAVVDTVGGTVLPVPVSLGFPNAIALSPDGRLAYVAGGSGAQVIDTTTNTVTASIGPIVGTGTSANMRGVAVSPDGKRLYLTSVVLADFGMTPTNTLSIVDTTTNALIINVNLPGVTSSAMDVAVSPDGKSAYVTDSRSGLVWVVDTVTNTLAATIPTLAGAEDIAFSPDGKRALVVQPNVNAVAVIDTATRTLVPASIAVGALPKGIGISPLLVTPPPVVRPFASFTASLSVTSRLTAFALSGRFTLATNSNGIKPITESVKVSVGPYSVVIPAGAFRASGRSFVYNGTINGTRLAVTISPVLGKTYSISVTASAANLVGIQNPVPVSLSIGDDAGSTSVRARF